MTNDINHLCQITSIHLNGFTMRRLPSMIALRAFETAARHLSFKQAANELYVTPSAVSHQIQKLEEELSTKLFRRFNRRIELTDSGAKYLARLKIAFNDVEDATRDLVQKGDGEIVSLAVPPMLLKSWMIPNLSSFYQRHPDLKLRLVDTLKAQDFKVDQVDCSIRYGFGDLPDVHSTFLFTEGMCPICSPKLLENGLKLETPEDLVNFRLIYTERRLVQWDNYLAAGGYEHIRAQSKLWFLNSIHTFEAVLAGLGVGLVNRAFAKKYIQKGELIIPFELEADFARRPAYYFTTLESNLKQDKINILYQWILDISKPLL